jgi:hypothetical protein
MPIAYNKPAQIQPVVLCQLLETNKMIQFALPYEYREEYAEEIADYVQSVGGEFAVRKYGLEFYVPIKEIVFLSLKYPFLTMEKYVW